MNQKQIQINKLQQYKELLQKAVHEGKISDWKINVDTIRRNNIYIERNYKIESILNSKRKEYNFTIYKDFENQKGESSFTLSESDEIDKFQSELEDAIFICSHSKAKTYTLPKKEDSNVDDSQIDYNNFYNQKFLDDFKNNSFSLFLAEKLEIFKQKIKEGFEDEIEVELNYLEFFNKIIENSIKLSTNIQKSFKKNSSYMEFVLTAKDKNTKNEFEHIVYENINDIYTFNFENFFEMHVQFAKDSLKAGQENVLENFCGKVILSGFAAHDFFIPSPPTNPLTNHAGARLKFMKISNYEIGKKIINSKFDKITIYSNPLLKNNIAALPCDNLGISAKKICIIKDSIFENFVASKQYGDYLGVQATGPVGPFEIESGTKSVNELYSDEDTIFEIVSFAWFSPDSASGNFSAEIRLGYKIIGGKKYPFKGGLFSGNVFKVLEEVEFSKEKINVPGYFGPKVLKFHKGEIIGM